MDPRRTFLRLEEGPARADEEGLCFSFSSKIVLRRFGEVDSLALRSLVMTLKRSIPRSRQNPSPSLGWIDKFLPLVRLR